MPFVVFMMEFSYESTSTFSFACDGSQMFYLRQMTKIRLFLGSDQFPR